MASNVEENVTNVSEERRAALSDTPIHIEPAKPNYGTVEPPENTGPQNIYPTNYKEDIIVDPVTYGRQVVVKINEVRTSTNNCSSFLASTCQLFCISLFWNSYLLGLIILPLVMFGIGVKYYHRCPAIPELPILLILSGIFLHLQNMINGCNHCFGDRLCSRFNVSTANRLKALRFSNGLFNIALATCFVLLFVALFINPKPNYSSESASAYCDMVIYMFAYGFVTFICLCILLVILTFSCTCCILVCLTQIMN